MGLWCESFMILVTLEYWPLILVMLEYWPLILVTLEMTWNRVNSNTQSRSKVGWKNGIFAMNSAQRLRIKDV